VLSSLQRTLDDDDYDVFISHRVRTDADAAEALYHALKASGMCCFLDKFILTAGGEWMHAVLHAVTRSRIFVPFISGLPLRIQTIAGVISHCCKKILHATGWRDGSRGTV
jgi:hypothetical protein